MKTVTEIARRFNISADTIRHYTKIGLLCPDRNQSNGYRLYGIEHERRLRFLLSARKLGFSLKDIREILEMSDSGDTPCPLVRKLIDRRVEAIREEMRDAQMLMVRMELASRDWHQLPDQTPSGESICHLIETWDNTQSVGDHDV